MSQGGEPPVPPDAAPPIPDRRPVPPPAKPGGVPPDAMPPAQALEESEAAKATLSEGYAARVPSPPQSALEQARAKADAAADMGAPRPAPPVGAPSRPQDQRNPSPR
jgi:hypothetical protein